MLLKPGGAQGSQQPPLAKAQGPLGAQVSHYKGLGPLARAQGLLGAQVSYY